MVPGFPQPHRVPALLLAAGVSLFLLAGALRSRLDPGADAERRLDAAFALAQSIFSSDVATGPVDLHDGRSPVPAHWQGTFERFSAEDRARPPTMADVVFTGSSSIELWNDLPARFPDHHVVQRGLGGATIADCVRHADRLILPYRPRTIVFYAGDNDLAAGVPPQRVLADFVTLVRDMRRTLPTTKIVFVSIKPSPLRAALMPEIRETNALVAAYAHTDRLLDFVDVFDVMLDRDAKPRRELFRADGLHMTAAGYAIWQVALRSHLD